MHFCQDGTKIKKEASSLPQSQKEDPESQQSRQWWKAALIPSQKSLPRRNKLEDYATIEAP